MARAVSLTVLFLCYVATASAALAQEGGGRTKIVSRSEETQVQEGSPLGFTLFFGADGGILQIKSERPEESVRKGNALDA